MRKWIARADRSRIAASVLAGLVGVTAAAVVGSAGTAAAQPPNLPATDTTFTLAVVPDTQNEVVYRLSDAWFTRRMSWLVENEDELDLRFVTHTGDLVNWDRVDGPDTITHDQYERASAGLRLLEDAGIPYSLSIGNHDAAATCQGGSACPGDAHANLRNTESFNLFFPPSRFQNLGGLYEEGKIDNSFHTFTAGGLQWLVLNLELWPRTGVVEWAKGVVADHPYHNVIVNTHSHLTGNGQISQSGSYGDNSPQYLFDELYSRYPNIRIVVSGHTGVYAYRVDTGVHGNRIHQILSTYHDVVSTRLIEVDAATGSFTTRVFNHETGRDHADGSAFTVTGVNWVRPPAAPDERLAGRR
ncbi:metallophosphoesterase [Micromonospora sp. HM5-17]|uniref:metallophosphoesterase n=1 Tax=Micromonospora sp. HM5-17 TaxID=2487710 RepID=UPI0018F64913|nr:metallophosphoesterase [Micromonospora sp. HM5-17]